MTLSIEAMHEESADNKLDAFLSALDQKKNSKIDLVDIGELVTVGDETAEPENTPGKKKTPDLVMPEEDDWDDDWEELDWDTLDYEEDSDKADLLDSVEEDEEEPDGKYYFAPMSWFNQYDPFNPPISSGYFGIFESGNQDFKLVDPFTTKIITEIMKGTDLKYLKENTNEIERKMIQEYEEILKKWSKEIDVTEYENKDFWIKNRKFIQNDGQLKYLLHRRKELWEFDIKWQIDDYSEKVKDEKKILDSMINIFDKKKYFLYWEIN